MGNIVNFQQEQSKKSREKTAKPAQQPVEVYYLNHFQQRPTITEQELAEEKMAAQTIVGFLDEFFFSNGWGMKKMLSIFKLAKKEYKSKITAQP